jgi:transcriptional regulator with XRE-family HTH domain
MGLNNILKQLLLARGVEVAELARETHIARQAIADILSGKTKRPQNKTVKRLAEYFDVTPEYLLGSDTRDPLTELRAQVAALEKRVNGAGPALIKISLDDGQRQYLHDKYIQNEVVSVAGRVDDLEPNALETLYKLLFLWDEIIRKGKVNNGEGKSRGGARVVKNFNDIK